MVWSPAAGAGALGSGFWCLGFGTLLSYGLRRSNLVGFMVQASGSIYLSTDVSRQAVEPIGMSIGKLKDREIDQQTDR